MTRTEALLKVTVTVPVEAEEAVASLMQRVFRQPLALYTEEETLRTDVSVFLSSGRGWNATRQARLERGLHGLHAKGLAPGKLRIKTRVLPSREWAEAWKRHFKPLDLDGVLLVKPTWSRRRPGPGQVVVQLDPGLSFGTGQHPTTAFCLEELVRCRPVGEPRSLLDMGCGSGILAIAGVRLGYAPVQAFDNDPEAVRVAAENATLNGVGAAMALGVRDVAELPAAGAVRFDVVCANLLADLLRARATQIAAQVAPGGTLVLAGILASEFEAVSETYTRLGWQLVRDRQVKEWRSGAYQRQLMAAASSQAMTDGARGPTRSRTGPGSAPPRLTPNLPRRPRGGRLRNP